MLRMDAEKTKEERLNRVDEVIKEVSNIYNSLKIFLKLLFLIEY